MEAMNLRRAAALAVAGALVFAGATVSLPAQELPGDLAAARAEATAKGKRLWVFLTATDAVPASATVVSEALQQRRLQEALGADAVLVHVDLRLKGNNSTAVQAREKAAPAMHELGVWRHDQLPCAVLLDGKGRELGRALLPPGKLDKTLALLREVADASAPVATATLDAGKAKEHLANAQTLLQQKKVSDARVQAQAAVGQDPGNVDAWDVLALTAATQAKGLELAEARTAIALTVLPEGDARAAAAAVLAMRWLRLGNVLAGQKRDAEALFCWRHAMAVDRSHVQAGLLAAHACLQRKDFAGAVRDANEVLRRDFGNTAALQIRQKALPAKTQEGR